MSKNKKKIRLSAMLKNYGIDILLFLAFIIDMNVHFTGLVIHEWLGLGLAVIIVIHLLLHWKWMVAIIKRFFVKLPGRERFKSLIDILFFIDFILVSLSGILVSKVIILSLGITLPHSVFWRWLHIQSADWGIYLLGLHLALNWRWIVSTTKRYFLKPFQKLGGLA
ncbi:MAG: DUF4405 domain-containing protein [Anaerolineae bacterium]|jgi:hypothetical protein|nr:DUF4405 domain-containing protein [Anaerolineae bacterium]